MELDYDLRLTGLESIDTEQIEDILDFVSKAGYKDAVLQWVTKNFSTEEVLDALEDPAAIEDYIGVTDRDSDVEPWYANTG